MGDVKGSPGVRAYTAEGNVHVLLQAWSLCAPSGKKPQKVHVKTG